MNHHPDAVVARILSANNNNVIARADLAELSLVCSRLSGDLSSLMPLLATVIQRALRVNIMTDVKELYQDKSPSEVAKILDQWLKSGDGAMKLDLLRDGLEAATIVAAIAASDEVDRRSINEDAMQASITLMQSNLTNHLVPALSKVTASGGGGAASVKDELSSPARKRKRAPTDMPAKDLKKIYTQLALTFHLQQILMERLGSVIAKVPMDVQQMIHLTTGAIRTLEMDGKPADQLQLAAITILTETFRRYSSQRDTILDELLSAVPDLPKRRSFELRYSSATASTALQEFNTEAVGSLLSLKNSIHILSAILLRLVQACVVRPTYIVSEDQQLRQFQSGLGACQAVSDSFINMFLQRCRKAKSGSNTDSYRAMLSSMVEDFLLVLLIPEYPGARILVTSIQNILIGRDLAAASSVFGEQQKSFEPTYLNTAFDILGKICSVQARIAAVSKTKPVRITKNIPMSANSNDPEVDCHCGSPHQNGFLIQCDHCSRLHHGNCVGIPNRDAVPSEWICDACCLLNVQSREQLNLSPEDAKAIDMSYIMHHSFQAMTSHRLGLDIDDAVHFHLALWVEKLNQNKAPFRLPAALLENWDRQGIAAEPLSDEGVVRVVLNLVAKEMPFRKPIGFILKVMEDTHVHSLRKLALKVIDNVVKGDPGVMMMPVVTKAVSKRLSDESISVREGAVHLVGDYIAHEPRAIQGFQAALVPCLTDPGVSVRKRAIRIFEQILKNSPSFTGRATVCTIMLERSVDPKEEDAVRDLIDNLFASLWLENGQDILPRKRSRSDEFISPVSVVPGLVTPSTPPTAARSSPTRRVNATAEQMMEVVRTAGSGDHLAALLKKLLTAGAIDADNTRKLADRKKRQELGMDHCKQLIGALFELLIVLEEQPKARSSSLGKDIAATLETIAVFCTVYPYPVAKHIETILPYFKADNGVTPAEEAAIVSAACKIIALVTPELEGKMIQSLSATSLARDLSNICYRLGQSVLPKAIEAFSALAQLPCSNNHFVDSLMSMVTKLYSFLLKNITIEDFSNAPMKARSGVFRGLTALGNVCGCINVTIEWDAELESGDLQPLSADQLNWSVLLISCYRVFAKYLQKKDTATRCQALSALKGLFLSQPQLLLNMDHRGLFDDVMAASAPMELQHEALECWRSILVAEEERFDSGEAAAKMDANGKVTVSKRVSGDQNGDATVFGGVLNKHSRRLFEMMQSTSVKIRALSLELMGIALRQGLVNPNEVVPFLFALQGDIDNAPIRSVALQLLITEGEKRPDILRQRMRAGVKEAYRFQRRIHPEHSRASALVEEDGHQQCIFSKIFEQSIVKNRKLREGFFKSLLKLYEHDRVSFHAREDLDVSLLIFVTEVLAYLPFQSTMDPLFIIHHVSEIVALQGTQVCERFADFLRPHGLASMDEFDDNISNEDLLEQAARTKEPTRANEAKALNSADFNMEEFGKMCKEGFALALLIRLKGYLRSRYGLTVARCLEYDPTAKERPSDKALVKSSNFKDFSLSDAPDDASFQDSDSIVRYYALYRRSIREDSQCNESGTQGDSPAPVKSETSPKRRLSPELECVA